jgi:hypothetical protein
VGSRTTYSAPADVPNAPDIIRQEATKATRGEAMTIAMCFPTAHAWRCTTTGG